MANSPTTPSPLPILQPGDNVEGCPLKCKLTAEACIRLQDRKAKPGQVPSYCSTGKCPVGAMVKASLGAGYEPRPAKPVDHKAQKAAKKKFYSETTILPGGAEPRKAGTLTPAKPKKTEHHCAWCPNHIGGRG